MIIILPNKKERINNLLKNLGPGKLLYSTVRTLRSAVSGRCPHPIHSRGVESVTPGLLYRPSLSGDPGKKSGLGLVFFSPPQSADLVSGNHRQQDLLPTAGVVGPLTSPTKPKKTSTEGDSDKGEMRVWGGGGWTRQAKKA